MQGFFSGTYNAILGKVNGPKGAVGDITGFWSDSMEYKDSKVSFRPRRRALHSPGLSSVLRPR